MEKKSAGLIMVQRKIIEKGLYRHGQHVKLNSTTIHKIDVINGDGWGILVNSDDTIKLTTRGKSVQVSLTIYLDII